MRIGCEVSTLSMDTVEHCHDPAINLHFNLAALDINYSVRTISIPEFHPLPDDSAAIPLHPFQFHT